MYQDPNLQADITAALADLPKLEENQQIQQAVVDNMATTQSEQQTSTIDNISTVESKLEEKIKVSATTKEENLRILRERAAKFERERDEYQRRLKEIEVARSLSQTQPNNLTNQHEQDYDIHDQDPVEGKHLNKYIKKQRELENQLRAYQQQAAQATAEVRLKTQFNDFDKVVSKDNIEALRITYPELAQTLSASTDLYSTGVAAYTMIKKLGLDQQEDYKADVERIQKNVAKPRSLSSISPQQGDSPLSQANAFANGLTDELKKQLQREMIAARKAM